MIFSWSLYVSLTIFIIGLLYKIFTWFSKKTGISAGNFSTSARIYAAAKGILGVIFSLKILSLIKALVLDVILQKRILSESSLRWAMHMLIYGGFTLLLLMHALESSISSSLFEGYASTLNPFLFLRDLFGFMVIIGLCLALYRRFILKVPRLKTNGMDHYAIIIMAIILFSGIFLEGTKILSIADFQRMVQEYSDSDDPSDIKALETYWVENMGLASTRLEKPFDEDVLNAGKEIHEMNCLGCHSSPKSAFMGYTLSRIMSPLAGLLENTNSSAIFWYIHFLACFTGLAYLPFSKMFHIIASPISLLANSVMNQETSNPANIATRQAMELDACTHCGTCSLRCSSFMAAEALGNEYVLPSEKMAFLKAMTPGKKISRKELRAIQEGVYACTNCDRCTVVCPVGIKLKELWISVREELIQRDGTEPLILSPFSLVRGLNRKKLEKPDYKKPLKSIRKIVAGRFYDLMDIDKPLSFCNNDKKTDGMPASDTFAKCFGCQNCTSVCPVVGAYEKPEESLGLLPHQIMNTLGLGFTEMASGAPMIWDCLTCYQCQEHCPQQVKVTDILYGLKNFAVRNMN